MRLNKSDVVFQLATYHTKIHGKSYKELKQLPVKELKNMLSACIAQKQNGGIRK